LLTFSLQDEETYKREILPLKSIKDSYLKTIITADVFEGDDEGVQIVNIVNWLTK
jgi:predicted AAA+ superfamily ATPase